jgi:hypothetical protein
MLHNLRLIEVQTVKDGVVKALIALAIIAVLGVGQTARAEGPLPLKQGSYVREEVPCNEATNANRIYYENLEDGYGISWPHSACIITQVRKIDNVYYVTQKCVFKGIVGEITKHLTITIKNETSFSILNDADEQKMTKKKEQTYRWCKD